MVAAKPGPPPEPVSSRLRHQLVHPNRTNRLIEARYTPDGHTILAWDVPDGIVQSWDAATGKQGTSVLTGYEPPWSNVVFAPDGSSVFVSRYNEQSMGIERDGRELRHVEFESDIRQLELSTGELRATFRHEPARGIRRFVLSPEGSALVTFDELPGEYEGAVRRTASLWDVKRGTHRALGDGLADQGAFSRDGRTFAAKLVNDNNRTTAIKLFDTATGREKLIIPVPERDAFVDRLTFSPDGKLIVGELAIIEPREDWLKFWDAETGEEKAALQAEPGASFSGAAFSPDGGTLAVVNRLAEHRKLLLFDVATRAVARTVLLGPKATVHGPTFSADGKWIAVVTQVLPEGLSLRDAAPEDVPQPRIHLVEAAAGAVRETLVGPEGFCASPSFSPDGNSLVIPGHGKVLVWDLSDPPLAGE
ncbi:MAG: WD40 repeat domain-containing protein [Pirellulales bacterium]